MKKKFLISLAFSATSLLAGVIYTQIFLPPKLKTLIEEKGSETLGTPVHVGQVAIRYWPPITLEVKELEFEHPTFGAKVHAPLVYAQIPISLELFKHNLDLKLTFKKPELIVQRKPAPQTPPAQPSPRVDLPGFEIHLPQTPRLGFHLLIEDAHVQIRTPTQQQTTEELNLNGLNFSCDFASFHDPIQITLAGMVSSQLNGVAIESPLQIHSELQWLDDKQTLALQKFSALFSILELQLTGESFVKQAHHKYNLNFTISDFEKVRAYLPKNFPLTWAGSGAGEVSIEKKFGSPMALAGQLKIPNLAGQVNYKNTDLEIKGPFQLQTTLNFTQSEDQLTLNFTDTLDLTKSLIRYKDILNKEANVTLTQSSQGQLKGKTISFAFFNLAMGSLTARAQVSFQTVAPQAFNLSVSVPRSPLAGLEKIFQPLAASPLKGFLEAQIQATGDSEHPKDLAIKVAPLTFDEIEATLNFKNEKVTAKGPVHLRGKANFELKGKQLLTADINAFSDLSKLALNAGEFLNKPAGQRLDINLVAKRVGQDLRVTTGHIVAAPFTADISGVIRNTPEGDQAVGFNLKIPQLNLTQLATWVPRLNTYHPSGTVSAAALMKGRYLLEGGIEKSPLFITASVKAQIPTFSYTASPKPTAPTVSTAPSEPLLPNWPIVKNLKLSQDLTLQKLNYNQAVFEGVKWVGSLNAGTLSGTAQIQKIFDGSIKAPLTYPLLEATPSLTATATAQKIRLEKALATFLPEWKDLVTGVASGQMSLKLAHPSRKDFLNATQAKGQLQVLNGTLKTLPFKKMLEEKLSKIPGVGSVKPPEKIESSTIDTQFAFVNSKLILSLFRVLTLDQSELKTSGWVAPDKTFNLQGNVFIAHPPVSGPFLKANSDSKGRLTVPIHLQGDIFSPQFNLLDATIQQMVSRTLKSETERVKGEAQKQLQKEVDKKSVEVKKQLEDEAKKALKGLFGN